MKIRMENFSPEECENTVNLFLFEDVDITADNLKLSRLPNDCIKNVHLEVKELLLNYLAGDKYLPFVGNSDNFSEENFSFIQRLDIAYRLTSEKIYDLVTVDNIDQFIEYRRAFIIAYQLNIQEIIDVFIERHCKEWFTPLVIANPQLAEVLGGGQEKIFISKDGSAKKIGQHYYIHSGTNDWNKSWLSSKKWDSCWDKQLKIWQNQFKKTERKFEELNLLDHTFLVVPEKDAISRVTNNDFINSNQLPLLFLQRVADKLTFNKMLYPLIELVQLKDETRLSLPDSHLSANDYWTIFKSILIRWGFTAESELLRCDFDFIANYGDLGSKFENYDGQRQVLKITKPKLGEATVVDGEAVFKNPLRDCHVKWKNKRPLIKKSVLILGDSHCSIGASPFLSYLFSKVFAEVTFYWNPYFLNELDIAEKESFDFALSEISQRFINPTLV